MHTLKVPNQYKTEVITESQQINSPQSSQQNQQKYPVSSTSPVTIQPKSQETFWENLFVVGNARKNVVKLKTAKANFNKLNQLLQARNWQEADIETGKLMLNICRTNVSWLTITDCKHFPREELKIIDNLWIKYSDERFGFSMQKKILIACGGTPGLYDGNIYNTFGDQVGWRKQGKWLNYPALIFNINAPKGHLPGVWRWIGGDIVDELGVEGKVCVVLSFLLIRL